MSDPPPSIRQQSVAARAPLECDVCGCPATDEFVHGEVLHRERFSVHYNCMLLSPQLQQHGSRISVGILGFRLRDIAAEIRRVRTLICVFCSQPRANLSCCHVRCSRNFHAHCAARNGCLSQFLSTFRTYCAQHLAGGFPAGHHRLPALRAIGRVVPAHFDAADRCTICMEALGAFDALRTVNVGCCLRTFFHRDCLRRVALAAGYFFKCPMCNDTERFRREAKMIGVFVPDRDALWEQDANPYGVLAAVCEARDGCESPFGRTVSRGVYQLVACTFCGSGSVHLACVQPAERSVDGDYVCALCAGVRRLKPQPEVPEQPAIRPPLTAIEEVAVQQRRRSTRRVIAHPQPVTPAVRSRKRRRTEAELRQADAAESATAHSGPGYYLRNRRTTIGCCN